MKAEDLINSCSLSNIEVNDDQTVVFTEIALTAINMARMEGKQSQWISVEERLPEPHTKVFFIVPYTDHISYYVGFCHSPMKWEVEDSIFLLNSQLYRVTHWMPIPSFDGIIESNKDVLRRIKEKGD